ncbi:TIGR01777 family oxidoreductase [Psychrobacter sp. I-STPA6b]|uniref:TIGR01777 family oxidoreductase n=1 Tax=Psychrobacter sp. I-STPA6b TaxID=2585718 RepID=UPI001D0C6BE8|nr:TIGR01777 family oxidoreductase [Psychrobacter sp. I-STPA6b]
MNILISGGSGFLGSALTDCLIQQGMTVTWLTRDTSQSHPKNVQMLSYEQLANDNHNHNQNYDVIINLAGAGIADSRWTEKRKQQLMDSRLKPTQAILDFIVRSEYKPKLLISGSAIGWYGIQGDTPLTEDSSAKPDFAHSLCEKWEQLAMSATQKGVAVAIVRTGVVIDSQGGMLAKLLTPFKLGLGGKLGDGQQIISWIGRDDWVRAVQFIIECHIDSQNQVMIYNLTAPNPISNHTFTKAVGSWLNRPTWFTLPRFLLKLLFGEMATLLIDGQKVLPQALLQAGFGFEYPTIDTLLASQDK